MFIYNSSNFVCFYTSTVDISHKMLSTIVEILYAFTPHKNGILLYGESTIVEILYAFTPDTITLRSCVNLQ